MKLFKRTIKYINQLTIIISVLQVIFWIVLSVACVYGIKENKDFMEMFFLIYFFEVTIFAMAVISKLTLNNQITFATRVIFDFNEEDYKELKEYIDSKHSAGIIIFFTEIRKSQYLIEQIIISKCKKAGIDLKTISVKRG